ncbi:mitochondrial enolase superfamily member 1-like [Gigantopelta aegis]|uniref:mitochondrial enolase superfamily member 1-like n=1 Tax=Gigantopelta aegis TaxID=1735272 RepID=UPI001B88A07D|nr:mitochondrial enolase superfamily member 1-like [Gigantopelta aegis]
MATTKVTGYNVKDIRFPTSLEKDGSDAMNTAPDYSAPYLTLKTDSHLEGHGITFTLGKGNKIVCHAIDVLVKMVIGKKLSDIYSNFGSFWRTLTSEDQMRWLGPEKGVMHLAVAAIINALWDLWAKMEGKPLWKLLVDMEPEQLVSTIDFRYMADALTKDEALAILKSMQAGKKERESEVISKGVPAYTTTVGWLGYSDEKLRRLCKEALAGGWTKFKAKVGADLKDDIRRLTIIREEIGPDNILLVDANQRWEVQESIDWMKELAKFKITWIEEPTSPDDILGHGEIAKALNPLGIGVATGEACQNRVMFKQFLKSHALQYCQIDSCRLGGVNENLAVILMAKKYNVPVCPHGGGVGLCELIQHLATFDLIAVSGNLESRMVEFADHLSEHFINPCVVKNGHYVVPQAIGYSMDMKESSLQDHEYPTGKVWQKLIADGICIADDV